MGEELTANNLKIAKDQWIDKLRYRKIKLKKCIEKGKRKQENITFQRNQKRLGKMPEIEKYVEFWGGI